MNQNSQCKYFVAMQIKHGSPLNISYNEGVNCGFLSKVSDIICILWIPLLSRDLNHIAQKIPYCHKFLGKIS